MGASRLELDYSCRNNHAFSVTPTEPLSWEGHDFGRAVKSSKTHSRFSAWGEPLSGRPLFARNLDARRKCVIVIRNRARIYACHNRRKFKAPLGAGL